MTTIDDCFAKAAAAAIIAAWDDGACRPGASDVLLAAVNFADLLLNHERIPPEHVETFSRVVKLMFGRTDEDTDFDEIFAPMRQFLAGTPAPLGPTENVGSTVSYPNARPLGELLGADEIVCSLQPPATSMEDHVELLLADIIRSSSGV
jgi:hypothetical protein